MNLPAARSAASHKSNAYLPSHVAAAIDKRLTLEARKINDDRTVPQKRADLLASWLTTNEHGEIALGADIAVLVGAETLLGHDDEPGRSPADARNERLELRGTSSARHEMKSHGAITWTLPSGRTVDTGPVNHAA